MQGGDFLSGAAGGILWKFRSEWLWCGRARIGKFIWWRCILWSFIRWYRCRAYWWELLARSGNRRNSRWTKPRNAYGKTGNRF